MALSREKLYEEVWAQPMTVVAARYEVSANYLARVCECLNVPHPPRGYWAKLHAGKRVKRPVLPAARPGDETEWSKGTSPGLYSSHRRLDAPNRTTLSTLVERRSKHPLLIAVQEYYDAARLTEEGYLRPLKRNLVDVFVSREALTYALNAANDLFLHLEKRGTESRLRQAPDILIGLNWHCTKVRSLTTTTGSLGFPDARRWYSSAPSRSASRCTS